MPKVTTGNRLQGNLPKIGIRPTIDGRRRASGSRLKSRPWTWRKSAAGFIAENLGMQAEKRSKCVIADTCIGGFAESATGRGKIRARGRRRFAYRHSLLVLRLRNHGHGPDAGPKRSGDSTAPSGPARFILPPCLPATPRRACRPSAFTAAMSRTPDDKTIPRDVQRKVAPVREIGDRRQRPCGTNHTSAWAAFPWASPVPSSTPISSKVIWAWRMKALTCRSSSAGSTRGFTTRQEFKRALAWVKENCREGNDYNATPLSKEKKEKDWEFIVKMAMIGRDLMVGNPKLEKLGFGEEALGHNAIAAGFQGQRQWTDHFPNGDFLETMLNTSFDWNGIRQPFVVATENDSLNGIAMLFGHLLTNTAQIFSDVTNLLEPGCGETGDRKKAHRPGVERHHPPDQFRARPASTVPGEQSRSGKPAMKPFWEITQGEVDKCIEGHGSRPADLRIFPRRRFLLDLRNQGRHAGHHVARQFCQGTGTGPADCRRAYGGPAEGHGRRRSWNGPIRHGRPPGLCRG